jgi:hypothetical protein
LIFFDLGIQHLNASLYQRREQNSVVLLESRSGGVFRMAESAAGDFPPRFRVVRPGLAFRLTAMMSGLAL